MLAFIWLLWYSWFGYNNQFYLKNAIEPIIKSDVINDIVLTQLNFSMGALWGNNLAYGDYVELDKKMEFYKEELFKLKDNLIYPNDKADPKVKKIYEKFSQGIEILLEGINACMSGAEEVNRQAITLDCSSAIKKWLDSITDGTEKYLEYNQ